MAKQVFFISCNGEHPAKNVISLLENKDLNKIKSGYDVTYLKKAFAMFLAKSFIISYKNNANDTTINEKYELEVDDDFVKQLKGIAQTF